MNDEEFQEKVDETLEAVDDWISENLGRNRGKPDKEMQEQQIMEMRRRIV